MQGIPNPSVNSDLELFTREISWDTRPTLSKVFVPAICGAMGFMFAAATNYFARKPMFTSGIQKHIAFTALGVPVGLYLEKWNDQRNAKRDATLLYYIQTHPEDFPVTERVKYKDVLVRWCPIR